MAVFGSIRRTLLHLIAASLPLPYIGPLGQNGRHHGIDIGKAQAADGLGGLAGDVNIGSKLFLPAAI